MTPLAEQLLAKAELKAVKLSGWWMEVNTGEKAKCVSDNGVNLLVSTLGNLHEIKKETFLKYWKQL